MSKKILLTAKWNSLKLWEIEVEVSADTEKIKLLKNAFLLLAGFSIFTDINKMDFWLKVQTDPKNFINELIEHFSKYISIEETEL